MLVGVIDDGARRNEICLGDSADVGALHAVAKLLHGFDRALASGGLASSSASPSLAKGAPDHVAPRQPSGGARACTPPAAGAPAAGAGAALAAAAG
eukprot:2919714-Pyramimonas_sp.AAC.2